MAGGMFKVQDNVTKRLEQMIARGKDARAFFARVVIPSYRMTQKKRWITENATPEVSGGPWPKYEETFSNPVAAARYRAYKKRMYSSFPGGGRKMMINTNRLFKSVIRDGGASSDGYILMTSNELIVATSVPYAKYVDEKRKIMSFSDSWVNDLKIRLRSYLAKGVG